MAEQEYSEKADVYALGIIMWELLTRQHPFDEYSFRFWHQLESAVQSGVRPRIPKAYLKYVSSVPVEEASLSEFVRWEEAEGAYYKGVQRRQQVIAKRYLELMEECWDASEKQRPSFSDMVIYFERMLHGYRTHQSSSDMLLRLRQMSSSSHEVTSSDTLTRDLSDTGEEIRKQLVLAGSAEIPHQLCALSCIKTADGEQIVGAGHDGTLYLWNGEVRTRVETEPKAFWRAGNEMHDNIVGRASIHTVCRAVNCATAPTLWRRMRRHCISMAMATRCG